MMPPIGREWMLRVGAGKLTPADAPPGAPTVNAFIMRGITCARPWFAPLALGKAEIS
jgi:hypothetical protein